MSPYHAFRAFARPFVHICILAAWCGCGSPDIDFEPPPPEPTPDGGPNKFCPEKVPEGCHCPGAKLPTALCDFAGAVLVSCACPPWIEGAGGAGGGR